MTVAQSIAAAHDAYFVAQQASTREFWARFGSAPHVMGQRVLDIGCGHGAMSVALAQQGATVVGVDINEELVDWARRNVARHHPDLATRLRFEACDPTELPPDDRFDLAVCKDTMEHVEDVPGLFREVRVRLAPGGEFWVGFSPLFYSPFGDHGRVGLRLPWAHAVLPSPVVLRLARIERLAEVGLNGLTPSEFRTQVIDAGFITRSIAYNCGDRRLLRLLGRIRHIRGLERYATVSIYAVLVA